MNGSAHRETADAPLESSADFDALIASLRSTGADRFDPVRWNYIDVLAKRAAGHDGEVRRMIDARLAQALTAFASRFELARCDAGEAVAQGGQQFPHAAGELQRHFDIGDFKGLRQLLATLKAREQSESLTALVRLLEQASPANPKTHLVANAGSRPELKTVRNFRNTWSKLSIEKQVTRALEQAPKNAGPINSHMLVLRSLASMRDISPDYLNRFMSYAETLLSLDQGENEKPAGTKKLKNMLK